MLRPVRVLLEFARVARSFGFWMPRLLERAVHDDLKFPFLPFILSTHCGGAVASLVANGGEGIDPGCAPCGQNAMTGEPTF